MLRAQILLFATACASAPKPVAPTVPVTEQVEKEPLPPDPETEALGSGFGSDVWVEALEAGGSADKAGILMSEAKAARFALYVTRYKELRTGYQSDQKVWAAQRELYEKKVQLDEQEIQKLQPDWWDRHKAEIGVIGGFILGAAMTISIYEISH